MADKIVTARSKEGEHRHKGRVRRMVLERGENGVSVRREHEQPPMSREQMRSGMISQEPDPPPSFFGKKKALMDHVMDHFGDVLGPQPSEGDGKEQEPETQNEKPTEGDED